jgi:cell division protein FtsZ
MGRAVIGFGEATERTDRAVLAAERAMACPLIDDEIAGASKLMISISGGTDMSLMELDAIVATIADQAAPDVELAWGASVSEALDGVVRVALIAQGHRPQVRPQAAVVRAAPASMAAIFSPVAVPEPAIITPGMTIAAEPPVAARPAIAAAVAIAEPMVVAPATDISTPFVAAPAPLGAMQENSAALVEPASDAPLLDLIERLPRPAEQQTPVQPRAEAPAAVNLKTCTMDELWLGDFQLEDPRRASLVEQISNAVKGLFRSMTFRLGFGRHSMIGYRGGKASLAT